MLSDREPKKDNDRDDQFQTLNKTAIFRQNAHSTFFAPFKLDHYLNEKLGDSYVAYLGLPLFLLFNIHYLLTPLTVPIAGGIGTLVETLTRSELTFGEINGIKENLTQLTLDEFDQFLENIFKYTNPKSKESQELLQVLKSNNEKRDAGISGAVDKLSQELINELKMKKQRLEISNTSLNVEDMNGIDGKVNEYFLAIREELRNKCKSIQIDKICQYIDNELNAGKHLQNMIHDEALLQVQNKRLR